jgi:hypothetical protein
MLDPITKLKLTGQCGSLTGIVETLTFLLRKLEPWLTTKERRSARIAKYSPKCLVIPKQTDALNIIGIENQQ